MNKRELTHSTNSPAATEGLGAFDINATHLVTEWKYESPLIACRFDPNGKYLFAAAQDNSIQRWEVSSGDRVSLAGHESWLRALGFSPDGTTLYSGGYDGQLIFWNATDENPVPQRIIAAHKGWIRSLAVSPDGNWLATGGNDRIVRIWNTTDGTLVHEFTGHRRDVYSTIFHPQGEFLLSGDLDGMVFQWKLDFKELVRSLDAKALHTYNTGQGAHYGGVRNISFSPDCSHIACGGLHKATNPFGAVQEPLVLVLNWETGETMQSHIGEGISRGIIWRVIYHPSGTLIGASGGGDGGFLLFWELDQAKEIHKFKLPNTILDCDLHPDKLQVATSHHDKRIRLSRMQSKENG